MSSVTHLLREHTHPSFPPAITFCLQALIPPTQVFPLKLCTLSSTSGKKKIPFLGDYIFTLHREPLRIQKMMRIKVVPSTQERLSLNRICLWIRTFFLKGPQPFLKDPVVKCKVVN